MIYYFVLVILIALYIQNVHLCREWIGIDVAGNEVMNINRC